MIHYTTTEARKKLGEIVTRVAYEKITIAIGRRQKAEVLIMPAPQLDTETLPLSSMNATSPSFDFLRDEPELYSVKDLKKRYV